MNKEPLASRLLTLFASELEENVQALNQDLLALEKAPNDQATLKAVFRVAHTLKGASRAAGVTLLEQVCHALESLLVEARDGQTMLGPGDFAVLFRAADAFGDTVDRLKRGRGMDDSPLHALQETLRRPRAEWARLVPVRGPRPGAPRPAPHPDTTDRGGPGDGQVRVDAGKLDQVHAATSQVLIVQGRLEQRVLDADGLEGSARQWLTDWRTLSRSLRQALDRSGTARESVVGLVDLQNNGRKLAQLAERLAGELRADSYALAQAGDELTHGVRQLRMRPFGEACEPLARAVRDLGTAAGKDVELVVEGTDVEADRAVIDGLRDALLQLVRNAVDHGVEEPDQRARARKSRRGTVRVSAELRGDRVVVTVADDGAGVDLPGLRAALKQRGIPAPADDREAVQLLLSGGVSTRQEASAISGRGVGLDIVRTAAERIRGSVTLTSEPGRGTTFTISCPPTLATLRAVLLRTGRHTFAIPTGDVVRVDRVTREEIRHLEGHAVLERSPEPVLLVALARALGLADVAAEMDGARPVVTVAARDRLLAVVVDELVGEQQVVLRPVADEPSEIPLVAGAAILGTGRVAPVLDVPALVSSAHALGSALAPALAAEPVATTARKHRVLVVDDSITTRSLEQSVLEAAGYDVRTAVDGADAWKALQEDGADLVVADVEMPRMDGFALCQAIRSSKRFRDLPVVLVTALESDEHRAQGMEAGADAFIGKSGFDQRTLLDTIEQLLGHT